MIWYVDWVNYKLFCRKMLLQFLFRITQCFCNCKILFQKCVDILLLKGVKPTCKDQSFLKKGINNLKNNSASIKWEHWKRFISISKYGKSKNSISMSLRMIFLCDFFSHSVSSDNTSETESYTISNKNWSSHYFFFIRKTEDMTFE